MATMSTTPCPTCHATGSDPCVSREGKTHTIPYRHLARRDWPAGVIRTTPVGEGVADVGEAWVRLLKASAVGQTGVVAE